MHVCKHAREFTTVITRCIHYAKMAVTMYAHTPAYFCQKIIYLVLRVLDKKKLHLNTLAEPCSVMTGTSQQYIPSPTIWVLEYEVIAFVQYHFQFSLELKFYSQKTQFDDWKLNRLENNMTKKKVHK